jgi:hypothetical protein
VPSIARKLLRRAHHTLRELGDDALAPAALTSTCRRPACATPVANDDRGQLPTNRCPTGVIAASGALKE